MRIKPICFAVFLFVALFAQAGRAQVQSYNNMTLGQAIDIATGNNRDISNARDDARKASLQITEAASAAFPSINGFWDFEKVIKPLIFIIEFPDPVTGKVRKNRLQAGTDHSMGLGASLTQSIYMGGKVGTALKAAKIYRSIAEETLDSVTQNVVAGVVQAFHSVLLAREMLIINRESLAQAERNLKNVQAMFDAGRATRYDMVRARVQVANMKPNLLRTETRLIVTHLKLKEVLGISPDAPFSITGSLSEPDTSLFAIASVKTAIDQRPDLKASEHSVDLYEKNIKIVRGDFLPTLTAGSTFQYMGNFDTFKYDVGDWNRYWTASVNLSFPIFSGFKNTSKYKQAKTDFYKAKTNYRKAYDAVLIEVQEGVFNLRNAVKTIESQNLNIEEAEMALEMAESLYKNGKATQLEVFDAQLALDIAKSNMANALYEGIIAEITLKKSLGLIDIDS